MRVVGCGPPIGLQINQHTFVTSSYGWPGLQLGNHNDFQMGDYRNTNFLTYGLMKKMRRIQVGWLQILGKVGIISISRGAVLCCYAHQKYIACKRTLPQNWMEITRTPWNHVLTFLEHGRCPASYTWRKSNCFKSTWKDFLKISMLIISSYQSGQGANGHGSKARNDVQHRNQEHKGKAKCAKTGN